MRTHEDPCRDPASEARDDWEQLCQPLTDEERRENARKIEALSVPDRFALMFSYASEPGATPETDAMETIWNDIGLMVVLSSFSRRLERQRDGLMEALYAIEERFVDGCDTCDDWKFMGETARAAIAAVKGGNG
jgi:hypothetical protein